MENTKEIDIDTLKAIQLEIMQVVHNFCEEKGFFYSLTYGTLIGAIRHKGYIPWDDDIDICLPRPDYDRFLKTFNSYSARYKVVSYELDDNFPYPYAKVIDTYTKLQETSEHTYELGVNIDVFPIDGVSYKGETLKKQLIYRKLLDVKLISKSSRRSRMKSLILVIGKLLLSFVTIKRIVKLMCINERKYDYDQMDHVACVAFGSKYNHPISKKVFSDKLLVDFEDRKFYVISGYDEYLRNVFGDYMILPPEEHRNTHHEFYAYFINREEAKRGI